MLSICNKITGTDSYLTWTDRWSWQDNVSGFLFGCPHPRSIEPLLKIHGYDVQPLVEQKYLRMASELRLKEANFIGLIGPKFKEHLVNSKTIRFLLPGSVPKLWAWFSCL